MVLHLLCGIPGSGKSTIAERIRGYTISTDRIRKFLWEDETVVKHDKLVFAVAENIAEYLLGLGQDVIIDATNLSRKKRHNFITLANRYASKVILHWINCPVEVALERNADRERKVPIVVIRSLLKTFQEPKNNEGIDKVVVYDENHVLNRVRVKGYTIRRTRPVRTSRL